MDAYDNAIDFFKKNPSLIPEIWDDPKSHFAGVLFQSVTPSGFGETSENQEYCGDLCEIRSGQAVAWTYELTIEIMQDDRLPKIYASKNYIPDITLELLPVFAEWQRSIDKTLKRCPSSFVYEKS